MPKTSMAQVKWLPGVLAPAFPGLACRACSCFPAAGMASVGNSWLDSMTLIKGLFQPNDSTSLYMDLWMEICKILSVRVIVAGELQAERN